MKKVIPLIILFCSFGISTCTKNATSPITSNKTGSISFRIDRPLYFKNTSKIAYILSCEDFNSLTDTISVNTTDRDIYILISNVSIGLWSLEVKALDEANRICYTEATEAEVHTNKRIIIGLKWGNKAGSAVYFDGAENYITIASTTTLNSISDALTIEAWVKPLNQYYNTIIAKGSANFLVQLAIYLRPGFIFNRDYHG